MRRATKVLMVAGAGLAGHAAVVTGVAGATVPPAAPDTTVVTKEQTAADAALLVLSDFPDGWTEEQEAEPTEIELAYQAEVAECAGGTGNLLDLGGIRAQSPDFVGPDEQRVEESVSVVDPAVAEDFMARFSAPGVEECFGDAVRTFVAENFNNPQDPSESLPDVTVGEVTIEDLVLEPAGDEVVAYRVALPLTVAGMTVDTYVDIVVVRSGGSLAGLTLQSLFGPFPAEDAEQYIALAAERLPG